MNSFLEINTPRCLLNRITEKDIPGLQEIFNDQLTEKYLPELYELVGLGNGISRFVSAFDSYWTNNEGILWGIRHNESLIGFIAIMDLPENPVLFYAMHPNYRHMGYMGECIYKIIDVLCQKGTYGHIESEVYKDNIVSISLLKAANFEITRSNEQKIFLIRRF